MDTNARLVMQTYLWVNLKKMFLPSDVKISLLWNGTKEGFEVILQKNNDYHPTTKFEYQISKTEINFLDTTVFKVDNQLCTKLYTK